MDLNKKVRKFIEDNLIVLDDDEGFLDSDNIFVLGYVNSLFAMKLLNYVETEFGITVANEEMGLSNFNSVDNIVKYVSGKLAANPVELSDTSKSNTHQRTV
jgi:acyl carrier protein